MSQATAVGYSARSSAASWRDFAFVVVFALVWITVDPFQDLGRADALDLGSDNFILSYVIFAILAALCLAMTLRSEREDDIQAIFASLDLLHNAIIGSLPHPLRAPGRHSVWPSVVRITVGTNEDMAKFRTAFKQVMDTPATADLKYLEHNSVLPHFS